MPGSFYTLPIIILLTIFHVPKIYAQHSGCGADALHEIRMESDSGYAADFATLQNQVYDRLASRIAPASNRQTIHIPIVVHVIHLGESVGNGSNISDDQIYAAVNGLNARFNQEIGQGVNTEIRFVLAQRDPYGCPTNGINRVRGTSVSGFSSSGIGPGGAFCIDNDHAVKDLSRWPVPEYYNIWVAHKVCNGTWGGYADYPGNTVYDGTVIQASLMTYESQVLTHEVGHGFNLIHTFGGSIGIMCPVDTNCLIDGDRVCDTPPHRQSFCGDTNPCDTIGNWDNSRYNYMSYCSLDTSSGRFTQNQKERMLASLDVFPRKFLLESKGLWPPENIPCLIRPFITTWNTSLPGTTPENQIFFPGIGKNYNIQWVSVADTTIRGMLTGSDAKIITFPEPGLYRLEISPGSGSFHQIRFNNEFDRRKLVSVDQWGDIPWQSMENTFYGCSNMNMLAVDSPNLFGVTSMANMFNGCSALNASLGHWPTGHVRTMESLFAGATQFNHDIGDWNTSNVTNMQNLFRGASAFNQDIGGWVTDQVTWFSGMFYEAEAFNQYIGDWNTSRAKSLREMFYDANHFNQDIGGWDVSGVTDFSLMFEKTDSFNQDISRWNTEKALFMLETFREAASFNQDLSSWNTANVISMIQMFYDASSFNQDLGEWTLRADVNMFNMLDFSGLDCDQYSATLIGWRQNNPQVHGRRVSAQLLEYGTNATEARSVLIQEQGWTISGDDPSGFSCEPCALEATLSVTPSTCGLGNGHIAIHVTGGEGLSFIWSTGAITDSIQDLHPGLYSVTISDKNGCTLDQTAIIDESEPATVEVIHEPPQLVALGTSGIPPFHYVWNTGDTTNHITPLIEGEYTVTLTDADSCMASGSHYFSITSVSTENESIRIFPNPAGHTIFIELPARHFNSTLALCDLYGRVIRNARHSSIMGEGWYIGDLPSGAYLIQVRGDDGRYTGFICKQ